MGAPKDVATPVAEMQRQNRKLRQHLHALIVACGSHIDALDAEMKKPSDAERGKRIAALTNGLEMAKDMAHHFGLGAPLKKARKPYLASRQEESR